MACRELLRKLESRAFIQLPPRQHPGPIKLPKIETVEVDQRVISCTLFDVKPIKMIDARS